MPRRLLIVLTVVLAGCSQHDDLPPMVPIVDAPAPHNLTVATADSILFDLVWDNSSPSLVKFYRVYSADLFTGLWVCIDTVATTSKQIDLLNVELGKDGCAAPPGVPLFIPSDVFGVSSVSTGNVESRIVFGSAGP